ncbi:hypothetical protein NDK50_15185 [Paraburkholderia bryophila]|uniref:hypothetical protein n=1 Tax=Paraburkholderia bryophila TaxID=420952 RepID=UPI00234B2DCD|nr:hypothetical protein [Paraburkholderia bryophila]WCM18773.1 hypothetical protein NDK50_15185 [Paraburkholderia bryophila]
MAANRAATITAVTNDPNQTLKRKGGRHRRSSMDPGTQLYLGNPNPLIREEAWKVGVRCPLARHIRHISLEIKRFTRSYRCDPAPFQVSLNRYRQENGIERNSIASSWLDLFSEKSRKLAKEATRVYSNHKLNPYFEIFRDAIVTSDSVFSHNGRFSMPSSVLPDRVLQADTLDAYWNHPQIGKISQAFNQRFENLCKAAQTPEFVKNEKSFTRTARDRQSELMRLASHLIENAPSVHVAYITLWGTSVAHGTPISYETISEYRNALFRYLRMSLSATAYLGYTFLLKHDYDKGYYLVGFIYLRHIGVISPSTFAKRVIDHWNTHIIHAQGHHPLKMLAHEGSLTALEAQVLVSATVLTEPDFFLQVNLPKRMRSIFPSQSPVGKLSVRTRRRNHSATREKTTGYMPPLLEILVEEDNEKREISKQRNWEEKVSKAALRRSKRAEKGAKTRARQKVAGLSSDSAETHLPFDNLTDSLITSPPHHVVTACLGHDFSPESTLAATSSDRAPDSTSPPAARSRADESVTAASQEQPDIAASSDCSTEPLTVVDCATPTDRSLPLPLRWVSEIKERDANGNLRTIRAEVWRKRAFIPKKPE